MKSNKNDFLNNKAPNNPKIKSDDNKINIPYIICSAIWIKNGKKYNHQPKNIDSGLVVCGRRHHNCFLTVFELNGKKRIKLHDKTIPEHIQGFLTSDDRFVDREEASKIAFEAKQTKEYDGFLFSEDLY